MIHSQNYSICSYQKDEKNNQVSLYQKEPQAPESLDDYIAKIQQRKEPLIQTLVDIIKQIKIYEIHHFTGYKEFNSCEMGFKQLMREYLIEEGDVVNDTHRDMEKLNILIKKKIEQTRVQFLEAVLNSSDPKKLLFDENLLLTEENIRKRYRELVRCFHPDKSGSFSDENKKLARCVFDLVQECKDGLLQTLNQESAPTGKFAFYEKKGNQYWSAAQDFKEAAAGHFDKLKLFKKEKIIHLNKEDLEAERLNNISLARDSYKACCKIADKEKNSEEQIKFRKFLALCFYSEHHYLEAQLYAEAAIQLILADSNATKENLDDAIKILNKTKGVDHVSTGNQKRQADRQHQPEINETALVLSSKSITELSYLEKKDVKKDIHRDFAVLAYELTLKGDRSLIKYQSPIEEILKARMNAMAHKGMGVAGMGAGIGGGGILITLGIDEIAKAAAIMVTTGVGPAVAIAIGLATIGLGIWGGRHLWKKGNSLYRQPKVREKLNTIVASAINYYDKGKYNEFLAELSKEYEPKSSLIRIERRIEPQGIIGCLLSHGFRPDGIAYLLNLIGEVLLSGKISIEGATQSDLIPNAKDFFYESLKKPLEEAAENLDQRISELRKKSRKSVILEFVDKILLRDHTDIAKEKIKDSQEMPFKTRLEEMRYISELNIAIIRILDREIDEAIKRIRGVQNLMENNACIAISKSQARLDALKDFLWVISGKNLEEDDFKVDDFHNATTKVTSRLFLK